MSADPLRQTFPEPDHSVTDLVPAEQTLEVVVDPRTGEMIVTSDAPTEDLARYLVNVRETEWAFKAAKRLVQDEILGRCDRAAKWTLHVPGYKVTGQSPAPEETWNGAELREALYDLVDRGLIAVEAADAAVETKVIYTPRKVGITALRKLGGEVAATIDRLCQTVEKERRVHVTVIQ